MEDTIFSAFLQVLFGKIGSSILDEIKKQRGVEDELQNLHNTLLRINAALKNSLRSQNMSEMKENCLKDLKDVAYDANDVLDEYTTEAIRRRLVSFRKVRDVAFNPKRLTFQHNMSNSVDIVSKRVENIIKDNNLNLYLDGPTHTENREPGTSSLIVPSGALGREKEIENVLRLLRTDQHCVEGLCVVPIQGPPGLGKTFLARVVYNEESIDAHFHLKMWVHVSSNGFHVQEVTKDILEAIERREPSSLKLENLQYDLKSKLEGRRFFMVLDNVWSLSYNDWNDLLVPLRSAATGSRIVVTTQSKTVAKVIGTEPICLGDLSYEATMSLFCQEAFGGPAGFHKHPDLMPTIRKIITKCKGSPLAAKTLGSLFRFETEPPRWESILESDISGVLRGEMRDSYMSCYRRMPYHIRRCFEYLAVFPTDYEFQKETLIQLWMGQDYIQCDSRVPAEDVGGEYFDSLLNLSCFRLSSGSGGNVPKYVVHEHFHRLAFEVSKEECCIVEHGKKDDIPRRVRHSAILCNHSSPDHTRETIVSLYKSQDLYTLLLMCDTRSCDIVPLDDLGKHLTRLRALDLSSTNIHVLKGSIGHLKYVRFLNLSNTSIKKLPKSVTELYNLQTLRLRNCYKLEKLPKNLGNLVNLRHLDIGLDGDFAEGDKLQHSEMSNLRFMPQEIEMLSNLQTLPRFVIARGRGVGGLQELKKLTAIRGDLHVSNLGDISTTEEEAGTEILSDKRHLRRVKLQWSSEHPLINSKPLWGPQHSSNRQNSGLEHQALLQSLKPHRNINELIIIGYGGGSFPGWISDPSFTNLVVIRIINCKDCELPPLGRLPSLKNLYVEGMDGVKDLNCRGCFCVNAEVTGFPKLKKLQFEKMQNWTGWSDTGECNSSRFLHELIIKDCPRLVQLTHTFPSLVKLEVEGCPELVCLAGLPSLHSLLVKDVGEDIWDSLHLLTSLISLKLIGLSTVIPAVGLVVYTSLKFLEISSCPRLTELVDAWLPTKLSYLGIINCQQLSTLSIKSGALPVLEDLKIFDCPQLASLPEGISDLHRLERLEISSCPGLQDLPRNGVPFTLRIFSVNNCPSLANRCQRDWHKIRHVPSVWIDGMPQEQHDSFPSTSGSEHPSYPG